MSGTPGDYPHRVQLQSAVKTRQPGGATTSVWTTFATVWGAVEPLEGTERIRAMATQASVTHRVRFWFRPGIAATMRVLHRGRVLDVVSPPINPDEKDVEIVLLCREGSA